MNIPDLINGLFEFGGSLVIWMSVRKLYYDKIVKGVHIATIVFFTSWGYWNLFYYPHLDQWWSFIGGCSIVFANTVWVSQMLFYSWLQRSV